MNIDIAVAAGLKLVHRQKKFLVQLLIQLVKDQAALSGDQRAVGIAVFLIADIHNGLAFFINFVQHMNEILLIVPIIPVALGHYGIDMIQSPFHDIVHLADMDLRLVHILRLLRYKIANELNVLICKFCQRPIGRLIDRHHNLLNVEILLCSVLFNNLYHIQTPLFYG